MSQASQIMLPFASIAGKKVHADFDGGTVSSDGGVLFLRALEHDMGLIHQLAAEVTDFEPLDDRALALIASAGVAVDDPGLNSVAAVRWHCHAGVLTCRSTEHPIMDVVNGGRGG